MHERRRSRIFGKVKFALRFFYISLTYVLLLMVINFYSTWSIVKELETAFQYSSAWRMDFVVAQASLFLVVAILLSTIMMIVHRSLGPIPRIEAILERVAQGDYSMRVTVRKKDFLISFIDKLNKVLDLLEQKTKGS